MVAWEGVGALKGRDWWTPRADVVSVAFGHSPNAATPLVNPGSAAVAPYGGAASPGFSAHRAGGISVSEGVWVVQGFGSTPALSRRVRIRLAGLG